MAKSKSTEFIEALTLLAKEKGVEPQVLIEKIQVALITAIKKDYSGGETGKIDKNKGDVIKTENIKFDIDIAKGKFDVAILKEVVEEVHDVANEITLDAARNISKRLNIGDMCPVKLDTQSFARITAQSAKQVIKQSIKEVERGKLVEQWGGFQNEAISAEVKKVETTSGNALVSLNGNEVMLFKSDQIPGETLKEGDIIKVFVSGVSSSDKRPMLKVSRTHRDLIKRLFELEVPEISDGTVEIKSISREAGSRSKIAVISNNENVDALGSCIGPQRSRISKICEELRGEKIDVVKYSDDPKEFVKQALKPASVVSVDIPDPDIKACSVVVPDSQLSLAIGNKGQNAKLAAKLTGFKIDIKPESGFYEG